ncbi:hypothetical protein Btru_067329 [Bulinus truncatus]|nr:hypothetical protein Btru_067329 [Bulinus truncatus]
MAIKTKTFTLLGLIFTIACLVSVIVSFASDRWVVSTQKEVSGFQNLGLWSACFSRYRPPSWALVDKNYDGCWWLLDREMDDLRFFLIPGWFLGTQVLVAVSLVLQLLTVIVLIVNAINCFPYHRLKEVINRSLSLSAAIMHGLTAILLSVAVIMFGSRADNSRTWLEKPDQNYLSWSFGICVLADFLAIIAMMFQFLEFFRLRQMHGKGDGPVVYLTNQAPPPSNYAYSQHSVPQFQRSNPSLKQPAYAEKYSTQGSQSSLNPRPPTTQFAVSGAGEVYINGLANFDEKQPQRTLSRPPAYQEKQPADSADSRRANYSSSFKSAVRSNESRDYEDSKKIQHPVLPEYKPKGKDSDVKKVPLSDSSDNSDEDSDSQSVEKLKSNKSNKKKSSRSKSRSDSEKRKKSKHSDSIKKSESRSSKHRSDSKKRSTKNKDSDDERSRSKKRSGSKNESSSTKRRTSHSRDRSHSRGRSHSRDRSRSRDRSLSRDLSSSNSDSDAGSVHSRSRRRREKDSTLSRKDPKRRSASEDKSHSKHKSSHRTKSSGNISDDNVTGSEYSSKPRTKTSDSVKKSRSRDYSDTESVKSKQSKKGVNKPKGTYSSYYEY